MTKVNRLLNAFQSLEPQAQNVLIRIGERLVAGQKEYGNMDVHNDGRDYIAEMYEEAMDFCVYYEMNQERDNK